MIEENRSHAPDRRQGDVIVPHRLRAYSAMAIPLWLLAGLIILPLIFGPVLVEMIQGSRPVDPFLIFLIPAMMFVFAELTLIIALRLRKILKPTVFSLGNSFEWKGIQYDWGCISQLFVNPREECVVILFSELQEGWSEQAGFRVHKTMIEPSLDALVDMFRQHGVEIVTEQTFRADDLWNLREKLLKELHGGRRG